LDYLNSVSVSETVVQTSRFACDDFSASSRIESYTFPMNLFLDTANTDCWADLAGTRLFSGITTNPLLIQRAGLKTSIKTYQALYERAIELGYPSIQFQVFGEDWLHCAQSIAAIGPEVLIKIPANTTGFEVVSELGLPDRTTLTAVYSEGQVIAAEALQVAYTAPYYARLKEATNEADEIFDRMQDIAFETELLVASLRSNEQFLELAARGFSTFALPEPIARTFFESDLANQAIADFEKAARG
jgi:transaldolase